MWVILAILLVILAYVYLANVNWGRFWNLFNRGGWVILALYIILGYWYFNHF
ncbi:hypothetical protein BMS3Abin05_01465 [bacterium BMS3Abin05]|nr:hypothetical protein BMS3Abin05_01465 [bacterium BMS3Abin05]GBE26474.1 hypothetical protein BMS3Bbin03_00387 [bacterium BMS3Bbin03]